MSGTELEINKSKKNSRGKEGEQRLHKQPESTKEDDSIRRIVTPSILKKGGRS